MSNQYITLVTKPHANAQFMLFYLVHWLPNPMQMRNLCCFTSYHTFMLFYLVPYIYVVLPRTIHLCCFYLVPYIYVVLPRTIHLCCFTSYHTCVVFTSYHTCVVLPRTIHMCCFTSYHTYVSTISGAKIKTTRNWACVCHLQLK